MNDWPPQPPRAGDEVDLGLAHRFRLRHLIGKSTFGSVWEAQWLQTGTEVALKLARDLPAGDRRQVRLAQALAREAEALRELRHGHVARFMAAGTFRGQPALVLERLHETLESARRRAAAPAVAPLAALGWLRQIAEGVAAVHRAGWRHLDLKPSNVLLTAPGSLGGRAKLVDFGNCRRAAEAEHGLLGTVGWMAPEQLCAAVRGTRGSVYRTDTRTDVHGLGLLLFYLLTGTPTRFARWQRDHRPRLEDAAAQWQEPQGGFSAADEAQLTAVLAQRAAAPPPVASGPAPTITPDSAATWLADELAPTAAPCAPAPAIGPARHVQPDAATPGDLAALLRALLAHAPEDRPPDADAACALVDQAITALHALPRARPAA
ncbi:MAG: serine/threonine-protein kinase [Betaproteobacteria bacterium]